MDINIYADTMDTTIMTTDELLEYGISRLRVMLKLEDDAKYWLSVRKTPLQEMVLKTAQHHVEMCEKRFGISRYDISPR